MPFAESKSRAATSTTASGSPQTRSSAALSLDAPATGAAPGSVLPRSRASKQPLAISAIFALAALAILLPGLGWPKAMFFDEPYFVPEARALIQGVPNPEPYAPPLAKPPLGRLIIAIGMKTAGDNAFGWRIAGAVCGALTVAAVYLWAFLLLQDSGLAFLAAGLALFNNFLFVMSRIATVDVFLLFFLIWSLTAFTAAVVLPVKPGTRRLFLCLAGVLVGLAGACKWNAIDTLAVYVLVAFVLYLVSHYRLANSDASFSAYANNVAQVGIPFLLLGLLVLPAAAYSFVFWPFCRLLHIPFSLRQLAAINVFMWHFNRTTITNPFLISKWYTWPLNLNPLRSLSYLVGNPVVAWTGLLALAVCLRRFWKALALPEALVLLLFAANFLQWAVTPQSGLYYYYYYPCVMFLGVAIAVALRSLPARLFGMRVSLLLLMAAAVFFVRCYPQMAHLGPPWDCLLGCWP